MMSHCGWQGSLSEFFNADREEILTRLKAFNDRIRSEYGNPDRDEQMQVDAWSDCIEVLNEALSPFRAEPWQLIFEYELPRQGGRRPDVVLLMPGQLHVLEFKMKSKARTSDMQQCSNYVRDLSMYHDVIHREGIQVSGLLILTRSRESKIWPSENYRIFFGGAEGLRTYLTIRQKKASGRLLAPSELLSGVYEPLPSIVEMAKRIFFEEPLPRIRQANQTNIESTLQEMQAIVTQAEQTRTHHLILLTGVPGAGKTLVGLQFVHEVGQAVYASGNRPLVRILQDLLQQHSAFVQEILPIKKEYENRKIIPNERVLVFDEAQRAWDRQQMGKDYSEPELILRMMEPHEWSVVVGLVGEGQEIHRGEEGGLGLWNEAIRERKWVAHIPPSLSGYFANAKDEQVHEGLNLTMTLRSHGASKWHEWVGRFLQGDHSNLSEKTAEIQAQRFQVYVTRDLDRAREFVKNTYASENDRTYGLVTSSRRDPSIRGANSFSMLEKDIRHNVAYFNHRNHPSFCCNLEHANTEFGVQGLELDMAILCWGTDLIWENGAWVSRYTDRSVNDAKQLRLNSYRVLLTRGRDGIIVYVPELRQLDGVYAQLKSLGWRELAEE